MKMAAKKKMRRFLIKLLAAAVSIAFVALAAAGIIGFNKNLRKQQLASVRQAVSNAVVECYSLEGSYPPNLDYLHSNYGLVLDKSHYIYDYSIFASNIPPEIHIFRKN